MFLCARAARLPRKGRGKEKGEIISILYLFLCLLPPPLSCPPTSHPSRRTLLLQNVVLGAVQGSLGLTGGVSGAVPFASEEAKAAEVQVLPDSFHVIAN